MTKANTYTTPVIIFDVAGDDEPTDLQRMQFTVEFTEGRYLVYQQDLNDAGEVWNTTPFKSFKKFEEAVAFMDGEVAYFNQALLDNPMVHV